MAMADRARIFRSGGSQAVRLPKKYRFDVAVVSIKAEGDRVILQPIRTKWSERFLQLAGAGKTFELPEEPGVVDAGPVFV